MDALSILLVVIIAVWFVLALIHIIRKRGCGCSGGCTGNCRSCREKSCK